MDRHHASGPNFPADCEVGPQAIHALANKQQHPDATHAKTAACSAVGARAESPVCTCEVRELASRAVTQQHGCLPWAPFMVRRHLIRSPATPRQGHCAQKKVQSNKIGQGVIPIIRESSKACSPCLGLEGPQRITGCRFSILSSYYCCSRLNAVM